MPKQVFSEEAERKLIELWAQYQKNKAGMMMKRSAKEKEIALQLTSFEEETFGKEKATNYTASMMHNKVDNLKSKAKELYRKYRRSTATGSPAGHPSEDSSFDLGSAHQTYGYYGNVRETLHAPVAGRTCTRFRAKTPV